MFKRSSTQVSIVCLFIDRSKNQQATTRKNNKINVCNV